MTLDPSEGRELYGGDPDAYDGGRPAYPEWVWDALRDRCQLAPGARVLEIGPGTGLATRRLVSFGAHVTAVEPNASLAAHLTARLPSTDVTLVGSTFEVADLPNDGFDLAVAATSFHWVDPAVGRGKLRRVVRAGGSLAIWWVVFDDPTSDEFARAAESVVGPALGPPFQIDEPARRAELERAGFVDVRSELVPSVVILDASQIRALYATMAIVLRRTPREQLELLDSLETLVRREFGGRVERTFVTALYTARNP